MGRRLARAVVGLGRAHLVAFGLVVIATGVVAAVGIASGFDRRLGRWTGVGVATAVAIAIGLGFLAIARRGGMPRRMLAAAAFVDLAAVVGAARIFGALDADAAPLVDPWIATAAIVGAAALVNGAMLVLRPPTDLLAALRWGPAIAAWLGALGTLDVIWGGLLVRIPQDVVVFVLAGLSALLLVLGVVGAIVVGLVSRAISARRARRPVTFALEAGVEIGCPGCGVVAVRPVGLSRCAACGEPIELLVEEPRCSCGYLLGLAASGTCPECGRTVATGIRD